MLSALSNGKAGPGGLAAVFGLGNPGRKYLGTRHNVGFLAIDRLAKELGVEVSHKRFQALVGEARTEHGTLLLVKPQTFMNESGRSVRAAAERHRLGPDRIFVICDDLDLEPGKIRVRRKGSSGGHRGLKSAAEALGTTEFPRLRIGIGRPEPEDALDYVLSRFSSAERTVVSLAVEQATQAVKCWLAEGIDACMNRFN